MIPRATTPTTVRAIEDFRTWSSALAGSFAARVRGFGGAASTGDCVAASRAAFARSARISRALSRSTAFEYSRTCADRASCCVMSASLSGFMLAEGGSIMVAKGGVGVPDGVRTVTRA